jgi:hypothetical protein
VSVYFTSDHHFGHAAARSFYRSPFTSIAEMDQVMIDRWNAVVGTSDELWHLGDFAVRQSPERVASLLRVLNGHKHLVTGNNDDRTVTAVEGKRLVLWPLDAGIVTSGGVSFAIDGSLPAASTTTMNAGATPMSN